MEAALRGRAAAEVSTLLAGTATTLAALVASLAAVVPPEAAPRPAESVDPEALRRRLRRSSGLLEQDDVEAVAPSSRAAAPGAAFGERAQASWGSSGATVSRMRSPRCGRPPAGEPGR